MISVSPDADGGYSTALEELLGGPVACVPLHYGIQLCCNRGGLLFGLALARRALAMSLVEPSRFGAAHRLPLVPALAHQAVLSSAAFSPDGTRVVTASYDKTARVCGY